MQPPIFTPFEPPPQPPAPMRVRIDGLSDAWNIVKQDFSPFVIAVVASFAITLGFFFLLIPVILTTSSRSLGANPFIMSSPFGSPVQVVLMGIASFVMVFGMTFVQATCQRIALLRLRGYGATVSELFNFEGRGGILTSWALMFAAISAVASLVGEVIQSAGSRAPLSPGYFGAILASSLISTGVQAFLLFGPLLVIDKGKSAIEALIGSVRKIGPIFFPVLGMYILVSLAAMIGMCGCFIGVVFTMPILLAWPAVLYNDFYRPKSATETKENEFYPRPQY